MALDFQKINEAAENYRADMAAFLRAMISHPSESCEEKEVVELIYLHKEKKEGWCPKWLQVYIFIYKKEFNIILDQSVYYDE